MRREKAPGRADDLVPPAVALEPEQRPAARRTRRPAGARAGQVVHPAAQPQRDAEVRGGGGERPGARGAGARGDAASRRGRAGGRARGRARRTRAGRGRGRTPRARSRRLVAGGEDGAAEVLRVLRGRAGDDGQMTQIVLAHAGDTTHRPADVNDRRGTPRRRGGGLTIAGHRRKMTAEEDDGMKRALTCAVALAAGCLLSSLPPRPAARLKPSSTRSVRGQPAPDRRLLLRGPAPVEADLEDQPEVARRPQPPRPGKILRIEGAPDDGLLGSYEDFRSRVRGK